MDRRAVFFFGAAVLCALMVLPTPRDFRWVPIALAVVYVLLAIGALLDGRTTRRGRPERSHGPFL